MGRILVEPRADPIWELQWDQPSLTFASVNVRAHDTSHDVRTGRYDNTPIQVGSPGGIAASICGLFTGNHLAMTGLIAVKLGACVGGGGYGVFVSGLWFVAALFWIPTVSIYAVLWAIGS